MDKSWQDPDTGVVHAISHEGDKDTAWHHAHEMPGLLELPLEEIGQRFFRRVTMRCGVVVKTDCDESIVPQAAASPSPPAILRPWRTARDAPTCVVCALPARTGVGQWLGLVRGA